MRDNSEWNVLLARPTQASLKALRKAPAGRLADVGNHRVLIWR